MLMTSGGGGRVHLRRDRSTGGRVVVRAWQVRPVGYGVHLRGVRCGMSAAGAFLADDVPEAVAGLTCAGMVSTSGCLRVVYLRRVPLPLR